MVNNKQQDKKTLSIKRTICIGLGGTGRDILMQIRRLIVDRYGKLNALPVVSFIHIDTDVNATKVTGLKTGEIYHGENMLFKPSEIVTATMNSQEIDDLAKGLERRSQHERQSPYDNIASWFPPQTLRDLKAIENGAGAIRPVGRLAFFHNYKKIHTAIETAENLTIGHAQKLLPQNIVVESGLNIILVGSLCGGTGSGMFLDTAYSLREMYGYEVSNEITGYFTITPELYGNTPTVKANTYAALKELNYYASQGTKFEAKYDPVNLSSVDESRPPFDFVYLVGNRTNTGHKIIKREKLCQVIAHKIFADFAEEISTTIKAHRDNVKKYFSILDEHPRPNVQRYLSFGLAKIYFPRDLTINLSLNKLKLKLLSFWLYGEGQNLNSQELLRRFLLNWQGESESNNPFKTRLENLTRINNKTFKNTLQNWQNQIIEEEIENCQNADDRQQFIDKFKGDFSSQFNKVQPGETENIRGTWLTQLQNNSIELKKHFEQDILEFLANLLEPSNPYFSLESARSWLQALITELNGYLIDLEAEKKQDQPFIILEDLEKKWRNHCQIFTEIEEAKTGLFGKSNKVKNREFIEAATEACQDISNLIKVNFNLTLTNETLKIVNGLIQQLQLLKTLASNFSNLLQTLINSYEKEGEDLSKIDHEEINGEAIFDISDNDEFYQKLLPEKERRNILVEISHKINENASFSLSLLDFFNSERLIEEEELKATIDKNIEVKFGDRSVNLTKSVVNRFLQKYAFSDRQIRLQQILNQADVLLPLNINDRYFVNDADKRKKMIGFKQTDEQENKKFRDLITTDIGINANILIPLQSQNEIVIINEFAGFPLRIVNGLKELREQYNRQKSLPDSHLLHNDFQQTFIDIIPPDAREMELLQDVFYTCLAFNKIGQDSDQNNYFLDCYNPLLKHTYQVELSPSWAESLEIIHHNEDLLNRLEEIRANIIEEIKQQPNLWSTNYDSQFKDFVKEVNNLTQYDLNFTEKKLLIGQPTGRENLAKEGILYRIYSQFEDIIQDIQKSIENQQTDPKLFIKSPDNPILPSNKNNGNNQNQSGNNNAEDEFVEDDFVEGDIVDENMIQNDDIDSAFYNKWKDIKPLELLELKREGILTEEEIKKIKKYILGL